MRIGVVSDPHGCWVGLKAALEWLGKEGVEVIVCAGDVASFGPQPNECVSLLAERDIATVQGNSDRDILLPAPAVQHTIERTTQLTAIDDWCRDRLTIVHGGLGESDEIVDANAQPIFPDGISVVAAGHMHVPFVIHTERGVWVNAGSAGHSCDGDPRAALAVLEVRSGGWDASIHRISFDLDAAARAIRESNIPYAERLIETQRKACWW